MRRDFRKSSNYVDSKVITFSVLGVLLLATIVFGILMYGKSVDNNVRNEQLSAEQIASLTEKEQEAESASTKIGKSIEEVENEKEIENNILIDEKKDEKKAETNQIAENNKIEEKQVNKTQNTSTNNNVATAEKTTPKEVKIELTFQKPVEGEIIRQYAKDSLVYSETLSEWVTHLGIDIKADKTTVVNAAEEGTIKTIKNDPRYGLTVVVSHQDGYETVYANLLSAEFVKEKDKVKRGQAIGTIGNTAVFESMDEPHLHFEILKDSIQVDPSVYIK